MLSVARTFVTYRSLLSTLTARELKGRYRGSVLGFFWSLVHPLLLLLVYSFVFGHVFQGRMGGAEPYPLFLLSGMFPWIWFSTSLSEGTVSLVSNSALIRRSIFPLELLPGVCVLSNLVHFLLALPVLFAGMLWARAESFDVGGWGLLTLPLIIALQLPLVVGLTLGLAALHAHFKDVRDLLNSVLQLLMFMTPIFYTLDAVKLEALRWVVRLSPTTPFILAYQRTVLEGRPPDAALWLHMGAVSLAGWWLGSFVFSRLRDTLVEAL